MPMIYDLAAAPDVYNDMSQEIAVNTIRLGSRELPIGDVVIRKVDNAQQDTGDYLAVNVTNISLKSIRDLSDEEIRANGMDHKKVATILGAAALASNPELTPLQQAFLIDMQQFYPQKPLDASTLVTVISFNGARQIDETQKDEIIEAQRNVHTAKKWLHGL